MIADLPPLPRHLRSMGQLALLLGVDREDLEDLAATTSRQYRTFNQAKKNSPGQRRISDPRQKLKWVQRRIYTRLLARLQLPAFVYGGVKGRSAIQNARIHVGRPEVVACDVKEFFPHVTARMVRALWEHHFGAGRKIAKLLTSLTTHEGCLPQGAPTSTMLATLHALPAAAAIHKHCQERDLRFGIYVDDVGISGRGAHQMIGLVIGLFGQRGLKVAHRKTRIMRNGCRQEVTGQVVNKKLSVPEERRKEAKRLVHEATRLGRSEVAPRALGLARHIEQVQPGQAKRLLARLAAERAGQS